MAREQLTRVGTGVGAREGTEDGCGVGDNEGTDVGTDVGAGEGAGVGTGDGLRVLMTTATDVESTVTPTSERTVEAKSSENTSAVIVFVNVSLSVYAAEESSRSSVTSNDVDQTYVVSCRCCCFCAPRRRRFTVVYVTAKPLMLSTLTPSALAMETFKALRLSAVGAEEAKKSAEIATETVVSVVGT